MKIRDLQTFEQLETYLREFTNAHGDAVPYDFVGAYSLFLAIVENLAQYGLESDLQRMKAMTGEEHLAFLKAVMAAVDGTGRGAVRPDEDDHPTAASS